MLNFQGKRKLTIREAKKIIKVSAPRKLSDSKGVRLKE